MIQVDDDCIPEDLLRNVQLVVNNLGFKYGWKSNISKPQPGHWNVEILKAGLDNVEDVSMGLEQLPVPFQHIAAYWRWLRENKFGGHADLLRCYANAHTYGVEGYPHKDSSREGEYSTILYTNTQWDRDWGGATEIWDEKGWDIERSIMPHVGRIATFPGTRWHRAAAVSRICMVARMNLIFKVRPR